MNIESQNEGSYKTFHDLFMAGEDLEVIGTIHDKEDTHGKGRFEDIEISTK